MRLNSILPVVALASWAWVAAKPAPQSSPAPSSPQVLFTTSCDAAAWPPRNVGVPLAQQLPNNELQTIMSQIDPARIEAIINKLVSFGTRHTLSNQTDPKRGIGAARDWVASRMRAFAAASNGQMTVEVQSYTQPVAQSILFPVKISNILATLKGSASPERVYVVSGHYDSRVTSILNYQDDAPGADDDGSGVAISMELARIMATHRPLSTIVFSVVAGEEQGLYGSNFQAFTYKNASVDVQGMFTNDIAGSSTGEDGTKDPYTIRLFAQGAPSTESASMAATRQSIGGDTDSPARELARFAAEVGSNSYTQMNIPLIYRADRYLRGGDHESFLAAGYPAARFTEPQEDFRHQHQDVVVRNGTQYGDLARYCDFEFIQRVGMVNAAAMWSLANAPGTPTGVTINTTVLSNQSQFGWKASGDANVAGYEIVWRPTDAPLWTHQIAVGNVLTATVNLSKDNLNFGVRAVGKNGLKSPAAFPFPQRG